jgi:hypothetical protein
MSDIDNLNAIITELGKRQRAEFAQMMQSLSEDVIENRLKLCFATRDSLEEWELIALALTGISLERVEKIKRRAKMGRRYKKDAYYFLTWQEFEQFQECVSS